MTPDEAARWWDNADVERKNRVAAIGVLLAEVWLFVPAFVWMPSPIDSVWFLAPMIIGLGTLLWWLSYQFP